MGLHYPHMDLFVNPHLDNRSREYPTMDAKTLLSKNVLYYRQARKLSQIQLANRAGVSQSTISRTESGEGTAADIDTIGKLADALGVSAWQLLAEEDIRTISAADAALLAVVKKLAHN